MKILMHSHDPYGPGRPWHALVEVGNPRYRQPRKPKVGRHETRETT